MKMRMLKETDIEDILGLWNRNVPHDQMTPELLEEKVWDDKDFSKELTRVAIHDNRVVAFGMALVRTGQPERHGYIKMLAVEKKFQNQGIGARILRQLEAALKKLDVDTVRIAESAPNYLVPGLDPRYTAALVMLQRNGYKRFGETWNMVVDMSAQEFDTSRDEQELAARGFEIRRALMADDADVQRFLVEHWPAWKHEARRSMLNYPISLHLALKDGRIVGFAAYDCNNHNTGWFGPMGTLEQFRRVGIGRVLLRRCLRDIKEQGHRHATIPWVGPVAFYLRHAGAEISRVFYRFEKKLLR